jgi:tetratricopeptide (TPR) repeat protein
VIARTDQPGRLARLALGAAVALAVALAPAPALADKADALFAKGKAQLAKKQYAEACVTFEKVDELDPGIGAKLNVARCYEEWGRLVSAYRWYADAEKMAREAGDKRAAKIKALMEKLDPEVPRLTIRVPEGTDLEAAAITLDDEPLGAEDLGRERRIEPGPHVLTYQVGGEKKTKTIAIERGGERELTLDLSSGPGARRAKPGGAGDEAPAPGRGRRIAAYVLIGAGAASLGASGYLGIDARGDYRSALDAHCAGAANMCTEEGLGLTRDARGQANLATVFALAGVAAVAGGIVLYVTAPRAGGEERPPGRSEGAEALYLAPAIGDRAGLVVFGGRY